jgi:hypothetical protein
MTTSVGYVIDYLQISGRIMETLEKMRDAKYFESRCFHTGVVPELIKQLTSPIMLRVMYKTAGRPLFRLPWLCPHGMTMPPSTGHEWSLNGYMSMKTQSPDLNQLNTYGRFWSGA